MGKSQSGKTTLAVEVIKKLLPSIKTVFIISPTYDLQPTWDPIRKELSQKNLQKYTSGERYVRSYFEIRKKAAKLRKEELEPSLLIIDDVSAERSLNERGKGDLSWLVFNSVWINMSIVCIVHKFSSVTAAMRENPEHVMVFTLLNTTEIDAFAEQINVLGDKNAMKDLYKQVVTDRTLSGDRHAFMYIYCGSPPRVFRKFLAEINLSS